MMPVDEYTLRAMLRRHAEGVRDTLMLLNVPRAEANAVLARVQADAAAAIAARPLEPVREEQRGLP